MNASGAGRKRSRGPLFGEAPEEKVQTLADEQLKKLLSKQLTKETTLLTELGRKQNLCKPILAKDESSASTGIKTLEEFTAIRERENFIVSMREHGLTEKEIELKLNVELYGEEYKVLQNKNTIDSLHKIEQKIRNHKEDLLKPSQFSETIDISRKELETENASKLTHEMGKKFSFLMKLKKQEYSSKDPVTATLKEHQSLLREEESLDDGDFECGKDNEGFIGPILCSVNERVDIIPAEIILMNRISLNDILDLDKFKNYKAGEPNRVLYIKNLAKNTTDKDLAKLFARYYIKGSSDIEYNVLKGRMHGQAFVTFKDEKTATEALLFINGYMINDKPIIISYSKK